MAVKAAQDLRRVDLLLAAEPPDPEGGLFHSQQAAEKALKGFLTWHDVPFRRVHELDELRYPGAPYQPTLDEGRTAFNLAREVVDAILDRLPLEVRPL